jgi:aspartate/tyrosine/aromatic aminotransferase
MVFSYNYSKNEDERKKVAINIAIETLEALAKHSNCSMTRTCCHNALREIKEELGERK